MKLSAAVVLLAASANAFTAPAAQRSAISLRMAESSLEEPLAPIEEPEEPKVVLPTMSQSLPWMPRPAALTGALAGDVGFDPVGFAKTEADLMNYREAEVKHARLAMLAAAGWPMSELLDAKIANLFGLTPVVDASDRAPSVLNGGLGKVSPIYWIACLAAAAAVDFYGIQKSRKNSPEYFPGNLGFDPLGMYPKDAAGQQRMQLAEIKNGRLAMIAIVAFAVQEAVYKMGVVDETPIFFKPLSIVIKEYANSGYYTP